MTRRVIKPKHQRTCPECGHAPVFYTCGRCGIDTTIARFGSDLSVEVRCDACGETAAPHPFAVAASADEYVTRWHEHHDVPGHKRLIPAPFKKPKNYVPPEQMALTETEDR